MRRSILRFSSAITAALLLSSGAVWATNSNKAPAPAPSGNRSPVVVHPAFPIKRKPVVATHPESGSGHHHHHRPPSWVQPTVFFPLIVWVPVIYVVPVAINGNVAVAPPASVWQSTSEVDPDDGWTELMFGVPNGGTQLLLSTDSPAAFDFAEIVYQDGSAQVVDLSGPPRDPGVYNLAALDPTRLIDHVRIIAQATDGVANVGLILNP